MLQSGFIMQQAPIDPFILDHIPIQQPHLTVCTFCDDNITRILGDLVSANERLTAELSALNQAQERTLKKKLSNREKLALPIALVLNASALIFLTLWVTAL